MFDITSSKLLILGIVALLVIGPKDLPALLRTIGKYMGIIKRQAAEFRAQFDEAMRESELAELKKDVESLGREAEHTMRAAEQSIERDLAQAQDSVETALHAPSPAPAEALAPAEGAPALSLTPPEEVAGAAPGPLNGGGHAEPIAPQPAEGEGQSQDKGGEGKGGEAERAAAPQVEKSGA
jgi:sec-independent protein translocase protein TatB